MGGTPKTALPPQDRTASPVPLLPPLFPCCLATYKLRKICIILYFNCRDNSPHLPISPFPFDRI
ncbi:MAG: hypothetical protein F6K56_09800 [Moorea sp. SIO3G5]|nr:hypothetical protein [Moorena sp. SIO3G5]